jgi:alpha-glucoside transport system permease protein
VSDSTTASSASGGEHDSPPDGPSAGVAAGGRAATVAQPAPGASKGRFRDLPIALLFLLPALALLGALVVYPIIATVVRSLFDRTGDEFVGLANYGDALTSGRTLHALRNNLIWVVVAPTVVTAVGLLFAVLTERVRWSTAFKLVVFMPMAVSFLAAGVIFRLVYEEAPERGVANAVVTTAVDTVRGGGEYSGVRPRDDSQLRSTDEGFVAAAEFSVGEVALLPLVGLPPDGLPEEAVGARAGVPEPGALVGAVWLDFARGGGGEAGVIDPEERGMPGITVQATRGGSVVDSAVTAEDGSFRLEVDGAVGLRLGGDAFREPFRGVEWLGPSLVTPAIIGAYLWIWAGFAMVVIGAGLAAIPREALEAARVDGATEWQVFRRVTVPLLAPVLLVVLVTLMINVLKIFDLVLVIPPGSTQYDANVLALEMWRVSFGGGRDQGLGSALGVLLFLLVLPAMLFNIRRFRRESQ